MPNSAQLQIYCHKTEESRVKSMKRKTIEYNTSHSPEQNLVKMGRVFVSSKCLNFIFLLWF
jgi:hypothetical protein